jgi:hypothetical protein
MPTEVEAVKIDDSAFATLQMVQGLTFDDKTSTIDYSRAVTYARAREVRRDPVVKLARLLCIAPALAADWTVEATEGAPEGAEDYVVESFVEHKQSILKAALFSMIDYGWCGLEPVWVANEAGQWVVDRFTNLLVDITKILIDPTTADFVGFQQKFKDAKGKDTELTISGMAKAVLFNQYQEGSNFYGVGDLEDLDQTMQRYDKTMSNADKYDEKSAGGTWVVRYPVGQTMYAGAMTDNLFIAKSLLASIKSNGGLCIPAAISSALGPATGGQPYNKIITANDWEIEFKETGAGGAASFLARAQYLDTLKVRGLGLPERAILEGKHGTKAEAEAHADVALTVAADRVDYVLATLNKGPVYAGLYMNFGPEAAKSVKVISSPVGADEKLFLRDLYKQILGNADLALLDFDSVDMAAIRDITGIPSRDPALAGQDGSPLDVLKRGLDANGGTTEGTIDPATGGTVGV